ncbi:glycosyltransferase family 1 protein [Candidatus Parcubacteria bacterium]|nr:MAG: glycosyltransferase family 1 protein [Candidatus Parcubacteria bacterium]
MKYNVTIYCPDQHFIYDINTLEQNGVGGGITARIRMAHVLAARGHVVTMYNNCPKNGTLFGVQYRHFIQLDRVETDIFIASTSGGGLDLSTLRPKDIAAKLKILMVHGIDPPKGVDLGLFDHIYALSNFARGIVANNWFVEENKIFVSHRGVVDDYDQTKIGPAPDRDPYALVYAGHPSKGLDTAIKVLRLLRQSDPRISLHIYGGYRLWGGDEQPLNIEPGVAYHGLIGQRELAQKMQACSFSLNLQEREEPFGMVVIESMRAGCIVLASPVGAFPEIIQHGTNGFLIEGNSNDISVQSQAAQLIMELIQHPDYASFIRCNAMNYPLSWHTVAEAWEGHWNCHFKERQSSSQRSMFGTCLSCGADWLPLADGLHCTGCGRYQRSIAS